MTSIVPLSDASQSGDSRSKLYDRDFVLWCEETIAQLKTRDWDKLDAENLIEEIEGLAGRDRREISSRLDVLLSHLLKRLYVDRPEDYRGWEVTIREQRRQIQLLLKQSPSLKNYLLSAFDESWRYALEDVKADYPKTDFPEEWQYSREVEDLLSVPFWSEPSEE
ncbi:DUF29 domain-containing protein [Leptolyngbya ohadii]|uniref:DUF29 domain-containing protein n=1 Tax=Leptolyngbya ohadii TaxID=1962290 RepID=UPI000B59E4BC|nr:DUF29 domain-containing protein [Leptolyngbya ohadii]